MKKIVFTEEFCSPEKLFPFTLSRQIQDIRTGIFTIREKWEYYLGLPSFDKFEEDYKDLGRSIIIDENLGDDIVYLIHGNILPTPGILRQVKKLKAGEFLSVPGKESFVYCISSHQVVSRHRIRVGKALEIEDELRELQYPWHIFQHNAWAIQQDMEWIRANRKPQKISGSNRLMNESNIFMEKGARAEHCIINAEHGPVYIGRNATVMEGSMIRGPVAICEGAVVKMGARIYGATTIGPGCVAGGEIKNSVFFGNSNKSHDGYIGDSVIGEWCNLGAGTCSSNLKNNASDIIVWTSSGAMNAGNKCGVLMGDHTTTAINTSLNSGTVAGVCCNIFGMGLTPKYIPSFSWGSEGVSRYDFDKAIQDIQKWKAMKQQTLSPEEKKILKHIFDHY